MRSIVVHVLAASAACLALASSAPGYIRSTDATFTHFLTRTDNPAVQFYYSQNVAPGLKNRDGQLFITPDSTPVGALRQAMLSWHSVSKTNLTFLPLKSTTAGMGFDNLHTIQFQDTDATRAATGGALAVTVNSYTLNDFHIADSDILFNPTVTFSTTGVTGTVDIEAVFAHELGHALGASHNNLLGATMFQSVSKNSTGSALGVFPRNLSADDAAFASAVYPVSGGASGIIAGAVTINGGGPAKGALLTLTELNTGVNLSALAGPDGRYSLAVPAGSYQIYAEPFNSLVQPGNLYLPDSAVEKNFKAAFFGGNASPGTVNLTPGGSATADIQVPGGVTALGLDFLTTGGAGASGDLTQLNSYGGPLTMISGQPCDLVLVGKGLDTTFLDPTSIVRVLGTGITIRPGSLRTDLSYVSQGFTLLRLTVDVAARSSATVASIFIARGSDSFPMSGSLVLLPGKPAFTSASVTNSGSFASGSVSPGEIVSIFGSNLGSAAGFDNALVGFDPTTNSFPTTLGGVKVTFDGVVASIFYARADILNVQVPFEVAGKATTKVVVSYNGVDSDPVDLPISNYTPGVFTYNGSGKGPVIAVNQDGRLNTASTPAQRGSYIVVYLTGRGAVNYGIQSGKPAPAPSVIDAGGFLSSIGGAAATVAFGGWTPTAVGLAQANILVPNDAPSGEQPFFLAIGGVPGGPGTTIFIQ